MVIGERFAWAHIPKTGGDSTHLLFREIDTGSFRFVNGPEKHNSFRQEGVAGLNRVANIRRLPSFIKSWAVHYSQHSKWNPGNADKPYTREQLLNGLVWWLEPYTTDWKLVKIDEVVFDYYELDTVYQWIRTEFLLQDFRQVMVNYIDVSDMKEMTIKNQGSYQKKIHFSRNELKQIYTNCPRWRALEERVYGDVLSSDAHYREYVDEHRYISFLFRQLGRVFY